MNTVKKVFAVITVIGLLITALSGCGPSDSSSPEEVTAMVIEKFSELTQIPRPSGHEEQVSDYLKAWAEKQGFPVVQDDYRNLIIEVPATDGMEDKPLVVLQGHMDMVFAQKDGLDLDPLSTVLQMKNDGKTLTSDGQTSLGADDGIGIAVMECVAEGRMAHGPLRLIITTDEEVGCIGVTNLDPEYVSDTNYLINIDHEQEGQIVISSASAVTYEYSGSFIPTDPKGEIGVTLFLSGLTGGHSGQEIDKGRLNGIKAVAELLRSLQNEHIAFELHSLSGGTAANAIPTGAKAVLCIAEDDYQKCCDCFSNALNALKSKYAATDPDMALEITKTEKPGQVLSGEDLDMILTYMEKQFDGVYSMSKLMEGLVESSSNLGIITADSSGFFAKGMLRSSGVSMQEELVEKDRELAKELRLELVTDISAVPWSVKENNRLQKLAEETYRDAFKKDIEVVAIHAGLECGTFAKYNPEMDIVSIGPNNLSPHSVQEAVEIESIWRVWTLLEGILSGV